MAIKKECGRLSERSHQRLAPAKNLLICYFHMDLLLSLGLHSLIYVIEISANWGGLQLTQRVWHDLFLLAVNGSSLNLKGDGGTVGEAGGWRLGADGWKSQRWKWQCGERGA